MSLLQDWKAIAYSPKKTKQEITAFWDKYFAIEKHIYEILLENPDEVERGTVKELAEKFKVNPLVMAGFLDGINDSLKVKNDIETMEEDTVVNLGFDKEMLYKNMVDAKADWLMNLPAWDVIFDADTKKRLYKEAKVMHMVVNTNKIGRNDPCPCGSGLKYKKCCGK